MSTALDAMPDGEEFTNELADCDKLELDLERKHLKGSFYEFVKAAWPIVEPSQAFVDNWHIRIICNLLQDITTGAVKDDRWIFNLPPGTLKSLLIVVLWPAWVWARNPKKRILTASYGQHLSIRDNLRVRDIVLSKWFQRLFPIKLVEDQNTKTKYITSAGGWRIATSVDGPGTGEHPEIIIIDDPTTAQQAESEPERRRANDWFDNTVASRGLSKRVIVIVVMQRLHEEDLTGHLLAKGGVRLVRFPMRYEVARAATDDDPGYAPDPLDPRTEAGQLMIPQLIPEDKVRKLEIDLGPYGTAGQLQQHPSPEGGGLFKSEWWKYLEASPKHLLRVVRGWDTAATQGGGDYTVGLKIAEFEPGLFVVLDLFRDQLGPAGVDEAMFTAAKTDGKACSVREEREGGASGKAVIDARAKLLVGYDYKGVPVSGDKVTRAKPFRAQVESGNVYLLRGDWNEAYKKELGAFPTAKNDDQVDASSCAFNAVLLEPRRSRIQASWAEDEEDES